MGLKEKYTKLADDLRAAQKALNISKNELDEVLEAGESAAGPKATKALDALDKHRKKVAKLLENELTPEERQRRLAGIAERKKDYEAIIALDRSFTNRMAAKRALSRLAATEATLLTTDVFRFEDLIDKEEGEQLKSLVAEAVKDVEARHDLRRALKGLEIFLRVAAFATVVAGKIAVAVA